MKCRFEIAIAKSSAYSQFSTDTRNLQDSLRCSFAFSDGCPSSQDSNDILVLEIHASNLPEWNFSFLCHPPISPFDSGPLFSVSGFVHVCHLLPYTSFLDSVGRVLRYLLASFSVEGIPFRLI
mmetsp:Transcript_83118/g.240129  ORF Transcript_83118/g.240129 Transcript_83118/m.240129 type:complete len:123 (+) Transcript_83118:1791-2159(+)